MATTKKSIKGTRTEINVANAYLSESSAYTRYIFYAKQAEKENYFPVSQIFTSTADNEMHHGKVYFKMLEGGVVDVPMTNIDAGIIGDTVTNLGYCIKEEEEEAEFYLQSAQIADEEGFPEIASHFRAIAAVEQKHMLRFKKYLEMIKNGTLWKRSEPVTWQCLVCGYTVEGTEPPQKCPGCDHPYQHYIAIGDDAL